ncbi:hypothetical protein Tco_1392760 [Tanacetum coccineum]
MVQALIHTTRSLRTTFKKHKVTVVTNGKEAEGSVVKKFFGQGEQVQKTPDANEEETSNLSKKLQAKLTQTPRAWRLYMGKEVIEEGLGVGIILVSPDEKRHSRKPHASNITGKEVQGRNYGCSSPILQVPNHASSKNLKLQNRSVNGVGIHKAGIPQLRSFGGNQDKTIDRSRKRNIQGTGKKV